MTKYLSYIKKAYLACFDDNNLPNNYYNVELQNLFNETDNQQAKILLKKLLGVSEFLYDHNDFYKYLLATLNNIFPDENWGNQVVYQLTEEDKKQYAFSEISQVEADAIDMRFDELVNKPWLINTNPDVNNHISNDSQTPIIDAAAAPLPRNIDNFTIVRLIKTIARQTAWSNSFYNKLPSGIKKLLNANHDIESLIAIAKQQLKGINKFFNHDPKIKEFYQLIISLTNLDLAKQDSVLQQFAEKWQIPIKLNTPKHRYMAVLQRALEAYLLQQNQRPILTKLYNRYFKDELIAKLEYALQNAADNQEAKEIINDFIKINKSNANTSFVRHLQAELIKEDPILVAQAAVNFARNNILKGSSQIENNKLSAKGKYYLSDAIGDIRHLYGKLNAHTNDKLSLAALENIVQVTSDYSIGNCDELSYQACYYVLKNTHELSAEVYATTQHAFLVIGRDPNSNPNDFTTWGAEAVICDPWSNLVYPASEIKEKLKTYYYVNEGPGAHFIKDVTAIPELKVGEIYIYINEKINYLIKQPDGSIIQDVIEIGDANDQLHESFFTNLAQAAEAFAKHKAEITGQNPLFTSDFPEYAKIAYLNILTLIQNKNHSANYINYKNYVKDFDVTKDKLAPTWFSTHKLRTEYDSGSMQLYVAACHGNLAIVKRLLENGLNPDLPVSHNNYNALIGAIENGHLDIVKLLLTFGADPNLTAINQVVPLHVAVCFGYDDIVQALLKYGANVNSTLQDGKTPLHFAAADDSIAIAKLLIQHQANLNQECSNGTTPLYQAVMNNHEQMVKLLLEAGANPKQNNTHAANLLYMAITVGNKVIVQELLQAGIPVLQIWQNNLTPLQMAANLSQPDIFLTLLQHVPKENLFETITYLFSLIAQSQLPNHILSHILQYDANLLNLQNDNGISVGAIAFKYAALNNNLGLGDLLLHHNANPDLVDHEDYTPLLYAIQEGNKEFVNNLLVQDKYININNQANNGATALILACLFGNKDIVGLLMNAHPDINIASTFDGNTALHMAAKEGYTDIVEILLEHKAHLNIANHEGKTALYLAAEINNHAIVNLLLKHHANIHDALTCAEKTNDVNVTNFLNPYLASTKENNTKNNPPVNDPIYHQNHNPTLFNHTQHNKSQSASNDPEFDNKHQNKH